jgi:hypothetical protein
MFPIGLNSKEQQGSCCWGIGPIPNLIALKSFLLFGIEVGVLVSLISP